MFLYMVFILFLGKHIVVVLTIITLLILFSHHTSSQCCKARRFDRVALAIFGLLENGWGNPVETSCFATLTAGVVRKKY